MDNTRIEKLDKAKLTLENQSYTQILTHVIQNIKDPVAGFVWVYLSSLPPDWLVLKEQIKNKFNLGDDKIKDIFSYLNRCKLIAYKRIRGSNGKLGKQFIHVFVGNDFDENEPYKKTTGVKSTPQVKTRGVKTTRVENHSSGSRALQRKYKNKVNKITNKTKKAFVENGKKHSFADSMDMMACETRNIAKHEVIKAKEMERKPASKPATEFWEPGNPDYDRIHGV